MRSRMVAVSAIFGVLLGVVANLAYETARGATGPWFSVDVTLQAYSVVFVAAALLALLLAAAASGRAARIDESFLTLTELRAALGGSTTANQMAPASLGDERIDAEIRDVLEGTPAIDAGSPVDKGRLMVEILDLPRPQAGSLPPDAARRALARAFLTRTLQRRVWWTVAGPLTASVLFSGISAMMLVGGAGFAQTAFQLNTVLLLFVAYGWMPLLIWAIVAIGLMPSAAGRLEA